MTNKLTKTEDANVFLENLNKATGFGNTLPMLPILRFDAEKGQWKTKTDEVDENDKPIWKAIAEEVDLQIITTRKMVESKYSPNKQVTRYFSREYAGSVLTLQNSETKEEVFKGLYNDLKEDKLFPLLKYVHVLYAFYNEKLYRVKLSGSKLNYLFEYLNTFTNSNPAMFFTRCFNGKKIVLQEATKEDKEKSYYELKFEKGELVPQEKVIERVNMVNEYLSVYLQVVNKKEDGVIAEDLKEVQIDNIHEYEPKDELAIEDIPF